jgi:hypothetical protein
LLLFSFIVCFLSFINFFTRRPFLLTRLVLVRRTSIFYFLSTTLHPLSSLDQIHPQLRIIPSPCTQTALATPLPAHRWDSRVPTMLAHLTARTWTPLVLA